MKEFTQHIQLIPVGGSFTDPFDLMADRPFTVEFSAESDADGTFWQCDKTIVIDKPSAATLRFFSHARSCIVRVWDSSGTPYTIGTDGIPARAVMSAHLDTARLSIACQGFASPF